MGLCLVLTVINIHPSCRSKVAHRGMQTHIWLEAIAVMVFGISWLTKGDAILKDIDNA